MDPSDNHNSPTGFDGDPPCWTGGSGLRESLSKSILGGVAVPLFLVGVAVVIVVVGEIVLSSDQGPSVRFASPWSIWSAVTFLAGAATICVARFGLQNWFPDRYIYQPVAIAGIVVACAGLIVFALAGL